MQSLLESGRSGGGGVWRLLIDAVCCRTEFDPLRTPHVTRTLAQVYGEWRETDIYTKSWSGITSGGGGINGNRVGHRGWVLPGKGIVSKPEES